MLKEIAQRELMLFDLDGTIYVGDEMIDGAVETVEFLRKAGKKVCFLTNNSSKPRAMYLKKLKSMGLNIADGELYTSAQAAYEYIAREHGGKRVYIAATDEVKEDFRANGVTLTEDNPDIAVLTFDTSLTYQKIDKFCRFLHRGAFFIATHADLNCPHPISPMPDVGSFIEMIYAATGRRPDIICGKPYKPAADGIMAKYGLNKDKIAMIGDRLYTDIRFGNNFGFCSVLVLSGETDENMLKKAADKPDIVLNSVKDLM
ncbi:MAG: HAD-IIA family hydrolase [Clostridiales bacterium]|jgi:NagD protein|nr:HAD-IIA family hydrolase [Clostridiales bacterium]